MLTTLVRDMLGFGLVLSAGARVLTLRRWLGGGVDRYVIGHITHKVNTLYLQ